MRERSAFQPSLSTKAYYLLNGNANDYSGQTNTGTPTSITYPQGRFGQGALASGTAYITLPSSTSSVLPLNVQDFTISAFVFGKNTASSIYSKRDDSSPQPYTDIDFVIDSGQTITCSFRVPNSFTFFALSTTERIKQNSWNNVIYTRIGSTGYIYINGKLSKTGTQSGNTLFWGTITSHVINSTTTSSLIDEVIIESRAWTAKEVELYYIKSTQNYRQKSFGQLVYAYTSELLKGTYTLTGKNISTLQNYVIQLLKGSYTLTGKNIITTRSYIITLLKGAYTLTGKFLSVPNRWIEQTKNTSTFSEQTKNTSTFSEQTKNSSSWTEQTKN